MRFNSWVSALLGFAASPACEEPYKDENPIKPSTLWLLLLFDRDPAGLLFRPQAKVVPSLRVPGCLVSDLPATDFYDWLIDRKGVVCGVRLNPDELIPEPELRHVEGLRYVAKESGGITVSFSGDPICFSDNSVDPEKSVWQCFGPTYVVLRENKAVGVLLDADDLTTRFEGEPRIQLRSPEDVR